MNTALWILQSIIAVLFIYSGTCKSFLPEQKLIAMGQTGVEGLSPAMLHFIGITEILGGIALILPIWLDIFPFLTSVAALCLSIIMVLASRVHYKRQEYKTAFMNCVLFAICIFIAYGRWLNH
jgi:uncharacterized membrane protein YphA (DoxX/SURF4 family)